MHGDGTGGPTLDGRAATGMPPGGAAAHASMLLAIADPGRSVQTLPDFLASLTCRRRERYSAAMEAEYRRLKECLDDIATLHSYPPTPPWLRAVGAPFVVATRR